MYAFQQQQQLASARSAIWRRQTAAEPLKLLLRKHHHSLGYVTDRYVGFIWQWTRNKSNEYGTRMYESFTNGRRREKDMITFSLFAIVVLVLKSDFAHQA